MSRLKDQSLRAFRSILGHARRLLAPRPAETISAIPTWEAVSDFATSLDESDIHTAMLLHEAVLRNRPNSGSANFRYGRGLTRVFRGQESLSYLRKAVEVEPTHGPHWSTYIDKLLEFETAENALQALASLGEAPSSAKNDAERAYFFFLFRAGLGEEAVKYGRSLLGNACRDMVLSEDGPGRYSVHIAFEGECYRIIWGPEFLGWPFLLDRMLALTPYLERLLVECRPVGTLQLTLGDMPDGDNDQLCFSGMDPNHLLIPDGMFLASNGYADFHYKVRRSALPWDQRIDQLYWRGSLTGQAETFEEIFRLPRIGLVERANQRADINAKITDLSQFGPLLPELHTMCEERGLLGPREAEERNFQYKYLIDIDGNTNSWPGLFTKLLTGSPVIKLKSAYRQWYYEHLRHGENIWFIDDLGASLDRALEELRGNPDLSMKIGRAGAKLAEAIQPSNQFSVFKENALILIEKNQET